MIKRRYISVLALAFCLAASLIVSSVGYDPWIDLDDDGDIDPDDFALFAGQYGTSGTPINKTELLLECIARIDSLNLTLLTEYYNMTECDVIFVDASGDIITGYLDVDSGTLYVDDVNDRVGIGTTSPAVKLDVVESTSGSDSIVRADHSSNTTGSDSILAARVAGNSSGDPKAVFTVIDEIDWSFGVDNSDEDKFKFANTKSLGKGDLVTIQSDGNVGIGTDSPATKLEVAGNTTIGGALNASSIIIPTTTRYYSIPGCAWQPYNSTITAYSGDMTYTTTASPTSWYAPVNLPHGAVITQFAAFVYDNEITRDIDVSLRMHASLEMASITSSGAPGFEQYIDSSIDYATVNNQIYSYYVYGILRSPSSLHRLAQVRITYSVTETLP